MKRSNNITPPTDLTNSREYYGMYNSRDFYKGTSFKMSGEWSPNTHYFNDEYIVDFVSFNGALLSCTRSHISSLADSGASDVPVLEYDENGIIIGIKHNPYWTFIMSGTEGPSGKVYIPKYDKSTGELSWVISNEELPSIDPVNIKGAPGRDGLNGKSAYELAVEKGYEGSEQEWLESLNGTDGKNGADGDTYIPESELDGDFIVFNSTNSEKQIRVDCGKFRGPEGPQGEIGLQGPQGNSWEFSKVKVITLSPTSSASASIEPDKPGDPNTTYTLILSIPRGKTGNEGPAGDPPDLKIEFDPELGYSILSYRTSKTAGWKQLGEVGGMPGKSPKLIRVLGNPDSELESEKNDRILWGYDGVPVSEWTLLCFLDELKGDQNIEIGCPYNLNKYYAGYDEFGGPIDHNKIWFDPCDESKDRYSTSDFLYHAYIEIGGSLSQEDFEEAFSNLSNISGFEVKFAKSFEDLGEATKDKLGKVWIIPSTNKGENNLFDEYIVVHSPDTVEDKYMWEKWGSESISVDLSNYYTKDEVDGIRRKLEDEIKEVSSIIWNDIDN